MTSLALNADAVSALSVFSSATSDRTVIDSLNWPTSIFASTRLMEPAVIGTCCCTNSLNPWSVTFTSYVPGSTLVKVYAPVSFDTVLSTRFVSRFVISIVAPGMRAPEPSCTVPTTLP